MPDSDYAVEASEANFQEVVLENSKRVPVLVDFWAAWCAPCQMLMPTLAKLADEYTGKFILAKVNTDEERRLAAEYGVRSLPTVKLFSDGAVVEEFFGAQSEAVIRELLDRYVERDSDRVRAHALDLRTAGQVQEAIKVLEAALASDPQNHRIHLDLARACLEVNEFQRAEEVLSNLPGPTQMEPEALKISSALNFARVADGAEALETLEKRVTEDPGNCEARYQLSAVKTLEGDYEGAMEQLLEILRRDRNFRDDAGRKGLLDLFQILGSGPLVNQYRALMSSALH